MTTQTNQGSSSGEGSPTNGTNGFWKGKTEARIDGLAEDMHEVKEDVKSFHRKLDALADSWSHLPCHDPAFLMPALSSDCPPRTVDIGGRLRPDAGRFDALFEGWKGRLTFVVSSGVVSLVAFATIWIFIMSSSRVQALMKVADSLAGGK
jgi:hypothetical protein